MSLFDKLSDYVVENTEQVIKVMEEGTSVFMENFAGKGSSGNGQGEYYSDDEGILDDPTEDFLNMESPLNDIAENVLKDIMSNQAPLSTSEKLHAFKSAITWDEPFIIYLLIFHVIIILCAISVTKSASLFKKGTLLGFMAVIVRSAEYMNTRGRLNWERFATQDYFDTSGVFVALMICTPLLITMFCMLIAMLQEAKSLLIQVKRIELKEKQKKAKGQDNKKNK